MAAKGWQPDVLARLGVIEQNGGYRWIERDGTGALGAKVDYQPGAEQKLTVNGGGTRELFPRPEEQRGSELYGVEGGPDAISLAHLGLAVTAVPSARALKAGEAGRIADGRDRVVVVTDGDATGRKAARAWAEELARTGVEVRLVDLDPYSDDGYDVGDLIAEEGIEAARGLIQHIADGAEVVAPPATVTYRSRRSAEERIIDMKLAFLSADDPLPYRVRPLVVDGTVTVLAGRRGEHKSWLALIACAGVHRGIDQAQFECEKGAGIYVDAEMGAKQMARRMRLLRVEHNALVAVDGFGIRLPAEIGLLRELVVLTDARLLVLDSLRRLAPDAKEDKSDDVTPVMVALAELARDTDVAIMLIHHRSAKSGAPDTRGSSAIEDQADAVWVLEKVTGDPERKTRRRLRNSKQRLDEEFEPLWIDFKVIDGVMTMAESEPFDAPERETGDMRERVADYLIRRIEALRDRVLADGGWTMAQLAAAVGRDVGDRAFKDARDLLLADGSWEATGSTRARRIRPVDSGRAGPSSGEDPNGPNRIEDDDPEHGLF